MYAFTGNHLVRVSQRLQVFGHRFFTSASTEAVRRVLIFPKRMIRLADAIALSYLLSESRCPSRLAACKDQGPRRLLLSFIGNDYGALFAEV